MSNNLFISFDQNVQFSPIIPYFASIQAIASTIQLRYVEVCTYNQEHFIKDAVDSALSQSYVNKEIIVVDDASSDGTAKILEQYRNQITFIKTKKNQGANKTRNTGAAAASGDYLVFLDGDDLFLPWALDVYSRIIELKKPKIILTRMFFFRGLIPTPKFNDFGQMVQIVEYDVLMRKDRSYRGSASAIVVEQKIFKDVGGWTNEIWPSEIDDLAMKLGYSGRTVHILSHPTIAYRLHANNTMYQVYRFIDTMVMVIHKEKRGEYPGGRHFRHERYAFIGGPIFFWLRRGLSSGLYYLKSRLFYNYVNPDAANYFADKVLEVVLSFSLFQT